MKEEGSVLDGLKEIFRGGSAPKEVNEGKKTEPAHKAAVKQPVYKMNNMQVFRGAQMILQHKFAYKNREKLAKDLKDFAKKILERVDGK